MEVERERARQRRLAREAEEAVERKRREKEEMVQAQRRAEAAEREANELAKQQRKRLRVWFYSSFTLVNHALASFLL